VILHPLHLIVNVEPSSSYLIHNIHAHIHPQSLTQTHIVTSWIELSIQNTEYTVRNLTANLLTPFPLLTPPMLAPIAGIHSLLLQFRHPPISPDEM